MALIYMKYQKSWFRVLIRKYFLLSFVLLMCGFVKSQTIDSTLLKAYPFSIGNIGFAIDSMEFVVGEVKRGEVFEYNLGFANLGKSPVSFKGGKISRFITLQYEPTALQPGQTGIIKIEFEVINELPTGDYHAEIAVESTDTDSPFKFLYMVTSVTDVIGGEQSLQVLDSVPRLIFSQYNYNFGYLWRGKSLVHSFNFTNMGSEELVIEEITVSEGVSIIDSPELNIEPGGFGSLVVKVNTYGDYGVQHHTINILSNDPRNPVITLGVHGNVKAKSPSNQNPDFCYE
jgi:hypothetical protein